MSSAVYLACGVNKSVFNPVSRVANPFYDSFVVGDPVPRVATPFYDCFLQTLFEGLLRIVVSPLKRLEIHYSRCMNEGFDVQCV